MAENYVVYVAGPYRDPRGEWWVERNRRTAEALALVLRRAGYACVVPHRNAGGMDGALDDGVWLREGVLLLERCDAVVVNDPGLTSIGTHTEVAWARKKGIPVVYCGPVDRAVMAEVVALEAPVLEALRAALGQSVGHG